MSKYNLFAAKDMKAGLFLQPNFQRSIPDAMRSWEVVANEGESMISKFPNDYRLYHLAEFNDETGQIKIISPPADLGSAADVKRKPDAELPLNFKAAK